MTEPITPELLQTLIGAVEEEARETRVWSSSFSLGKGERKATVSHRPLYSFSIANPPRLQEEARGRLSVNGAVVECIVISRRSDGLDVETFIDLGDEIESATLTVDRSDLLSVLAARLEAVVSDDPPFSFNKRLAAQVVDSSQIPDQESDEFIAAPDDLTTDQQEAFRRALRNETTFLWGPPGTGKTVTLSAIAFNLFCHNKRVLLVSHTNRAVDGIVLGLCKRIVGKSRLNLPEGSIVRIGQVSRKALQGAFGQQISLEHLAESQQRKARERIGLLRKERELCARELEGLRRQQGLIAKQGVLQEELVHLQKMYAEARTSESSLATVLRVLRIRYGAGDGTGSSIDDIKRSMKAVTGEIVGVVSELEGASAEELSDRVTDLESRDEELAEAIRDLEALTEDTNSSAIQRARVVACTASQAVLRCQNLGRFDAVIIDEASMLPLPYVAFLAGLAQERVVVGGDFRQLPPISLSTSSLARQWFARDVFEISGVVDLVDNREERPFLATLTTQFRGHEALSSLVNERFYGGRLVAQRKEAPPMDLPALPDWLTRGSLLLVDTSELEPRGRVDNNSKANLAHALVVRSICAALRSAGLGASASDIGVIAPFRAQVSLLEDLLEEAGLSEIAVGTVHRFQGAERETIILDLTESPPHNLSSFLGGVSLRDPGSRLLNVALSRAQARLIVVANLSYLRERLTERHLLSGVLTEIEQRGSFVDVKEVIPDAVTANGPAASDLCSPQRFDAETFLAGMATDLREARSSVLISSTEVGERTAHILATVLKAVVERGVQVRVVTQANGDSHWGIFASRGATVETATSPLVQGVVIDNEIVWIGNTPPAHCVDAPSVVMTRLVSSIAAQSLAKEIPSAHVDRSRDQAVAANS